MEYRTLGRTGWQVAEVSCGTYKTFDVRGAAGQAKVMELMQANLALGINLFDSAPMYGHSEANIGHAVGQLQGGNVDPSSYLIATKVLQHDLAGAKGQIENSFKVIGGRIDLLQIHNMAGWKAVLPYLSELKAQGKILATGITHYDTSAFGAMEEALNTGLADVIQIPCNLMERQVEQRLLPLARDMNVGVLVMTPIRPMFRRTGILDRLAKVELAEYKGFGVSDVGSLCLKYLLSKHPDMILIPATSRPRRVASNAAVSGTPPLPPEVITRLEAIADG